MSKKEDRKNYNTQGIQKNQNSSKKFGHCDNRSHANSNDFRKKTNFEEELQRYGRLIYPNVGVSMMPLLRQHRDLMIIEPTKGRCKKYDAVLYRRSNGQYVLHRILKVREKDYVICGDNCYTCEYGITDAHILGVLTGFVRDGKTYHVDNRAYQCYVHIWCDFFPIRAFLLKSKAWIKRKMKAIIKN